jgi:DNA-binding CsgD family transcriptional regulator
VLKADPAAAPAMAGWEQFFWMIFNRSSVPMCLIDDRRVGVAANQAYCDYIRRPASELVGRLADLDISPPTLERFKAEWERLMRSGRWSGSLDIVRSDGVVLRSDFAARATAVNGHKLVLGVLHAGEPATEVSGPATGKLTERERTVVHLLTLGLTSAEIADRLTISVQTVRTHVRNAMTKTGTKTRAQLVAVALSDRHTHGVDGS